MEQLTWKVISKFLIKAAISYAVNVATSKLFGKKQKGGRPNPLATAVDSTSAIPVIYGCRKTGGNLIWESLSGNTCKRILTFCSGKINRIYGVCFNNLLAVTGPVFKIKNTQHADATISVIETNTPSKNDKLLTLYANGETYNIILCHSNDAGHEGIQEYNYDVAALTRYINDLGDGWETVDPVYSSNACETIHNINLTSCYNTPIDVIVDGFKGCSYTAYMGDGEQEIDSRVPGDTQADKAKIVGGLKYDAYIAITAKLSENLPNGFNVTAFIEGKIVRVFTTPTTYTEQYSSNPAWCILDYQTSYDTCGIENSSIDIQKYIEAAPYFAAPERNWSINLLLNQKETRQDTLNEMYFACRSFPTYQKGKHGILVDKPEAVCQVFDILPTDELEFSWEDDFERLDIKYADPDYDWQMIPARAETPTFRKDDPVKKEIEADAITNHRQASQLSWFHLNQSVTAPMMARYKTNLRARNRSIGDIIATNDPIMELQLKKWRVMGMTEPQGMKIELALREYNEDLYTDQLGSARPIVNISPLSNPANSPPEVSGIALTQTYYRLRDATIVSYIDGSCVLPEYQFFSDAILEYSEDNGSNWVESGKVNLDGTFRINNVKTGISYLIKITVRNKMGILSNGSVSDSIYITGKDTPPSNVATLNAAIDPTDSTKIKISWAAVSDIDLNGYRIMEGSTVLTPNPISDTQYVYAATQSRQHNFKVVAVDNSDNESEVPAEKSITVVIEPAQVAGFNIATQETDRSKLILTWQANAEKDISYYIVKQGSNWDTAVLVATQLKATSYSYDLTAEGNQTYMIKAVNVAGHESVVASVKTIQIILRPDSPANLTATQEPQNRARLNLSWAASGGKDIAGYELRLGTQWDTGEYIDFTRETKYTYIISTSGTFTIMVKAKTVAGYYSNVANVLVAVMIEAYDVTGFAAMQMIADRTRVRLSWDKPLSLDVAYFEIRKGATWDSGQVVESRATGTFYDVVVTQETEQTFWIKAVTVAGKYSQYPARVSDIFNLRPNPVSNIRITQQPNDKSVVVITWDATPESDLAGYQVKVGYVWETAEALPPTKELTCLYTPSSTDNLKVMIKALNAAAYYSDEVFKVYYATLEPLAVTGFQVLQNGENVQFYWDKHPENDVVAYEIREGASFDGGTLIDTGITLNSHSVKVDVERNYQYHIKAINRSNRYSQTSAKQTIYVSNLPPKNVILEYDEITRQDGSHNNTEFGLSAINWQTIGGGWNDHPGVKFSEVGGQNVLKLKEKNLLLSNRRDFSTYTAYNSAVISVTQNQTVEDWNTDKATRIQITGGTSTLKMRISWNQVSVTQGETYTASLKIKNTGTKSVRFYLVAGGATSYVTVSAGQTANLAVSAAAGASTTVNEIRFYTLAIDDALDFLAYQPQVEIGAEANPYGSYYESGQYDCQRIDIGQVTTCNIGNLFTSSVNLRGVGSAKLQIRTSQNGTDFTNWQDFRPAEYTFRYLDRRVLLETDDPTNTPEVGQFSTRIDVPDTTQTGTVTVPVGGISVLYSKQFYTDPVITGTAIGANRFPEITTETKYGHTIKIVDRTGADVGGKYNYSAKGY